MWNYIIGDTNGDTIVGDTNGDTIEVRGIGVRAIGVGGIGGAGGLLASAIIGGTGELLASAKRMGIVRPMRNSFVDNVLRDNVQPVPGSVVMCDLLTFEHTGIYVGNGKIVHRRGGDDGCIEAVGPQEFLDRLDGWNNAISVYVSCWGKLAIGWKAAADRAERALLPSHSQHSGYCILNHNCHHFTRWCLTGDADQWGFDNSFTSLETLLMRNYGMDNWRVWDFRG